MADSTGNLQLPYILPSQAQKHVTHNEALQMLDAITHLAITATLATPPETPPATACYLVAAGATGVWTGKSGRIAARQDGAWIYLTPREGWLAWFAEDNHIRTFNDGLWLDLPLPDTVSSGRIGINATPDSTNRLSIAASASLFSHDGTGHQIKVNKAATAETASLLFQDAWSGRAEMGLMGADDFSIKTSGDGSSWVTALSIGADGNVAMPRRPAVRAAMNTATLTPATGSMTGFQQMPVSRGGFSLGAAVPTGSGSRLVIPATGLYLLAIVFQVTSSSGHTIALVKNGTTTLATLSGASSSGGTITQSAMTIVALAQGDWLACSHTGTASFAFGPGKTEVSACLL